MDDEYEDWDLADLESNGWTVESIARLAAHEAAVLAPQTVEELVQDTMIEEWLAESEPPDAA